MFRDIAREKLKSSLLKRIILRVDYKGVIDLDDIIKKINEEKILDEFSLEERYISKVDFDFQDPEEVETTLSIPIKELTKIRLYEYLKDSYFKIEISKYFCSISIDSDGRYVKFEDYKNLFLNILGVIEKLNEKLAYIRIGLRKIDQVFLHDINLLYDFFNKDLFSFAPIIFEKTNEIIRSELKETFKIDSIQINLVRFVDTGVLKTTTDETKDVYRVLLDTDSYERGNDILSEKGGSPKLNELLEKYNNLQFSLFRNCITDVFYESLKNGTVDKDKIIGVYNGI